MKFSVVIPTFRRPQSLEYCLESLSKQEAPVDEVLVVLRSEDSDTRAVLSRWTHFSALRPVEVSTQGAISQYNAGLRAATGDIVAITDDDAAPHPDWSRRIQEHFAADPTLGGVGGRDYVHEDGRVLAGPAPQVGTVQWFGRIVGNHHLGTRFLPKVDILKGVNMSFRASAIRDLYFDVDLRGKGAQTCLDMAFSLEVQKRGWQLLYDPAVAVEHYPAPRFDADQRGAPTQQASEDTSFNLYLTLLRHMRPGLRRWMALWWVRTIGNKSTPGWARGMWAHLRGQHETVQLRHAANRAWIDARSEMKGGAR